MLPPAPGRSPALGVTAPFFVAAPLGLVAAGLLLATSGTDAFLAINVPRTVAVTHAAVIGWLTAAIFGAIYQLGPAVLGGRLVSERLARVQFYVHAVSVTAFVWSLLEWNVVVMSAAGSGVVVSFVLFLVNGWPAVRALRPSTLPRAYLATAMALLAVTASVGITFVGTLEHLWFPVTLGRLGGHAHLGLVGWLALVVMGTSYQLVPMFNISHGARPRLGWWALGVTAAATLVGGIGLMTDPPREVRLVLALLLAAGPALWSVDMLRILRSRARRRLDIQGHATCVSLVFLAAAVALGIAVAWGSPILGREDAARWHLAYGVIAIGGWAGVTLIGNSYKIVPFLTWYHRYREQAGIRPVPMIADIYSARWAYVTLVAHSAAVVLIAAGALTAHLALLQTGGALLAAGGLVHVAALAHVVLAPHAARTPVKTVNEAISR
ncbi:MAG: hypothetical protein IT303_11900 [Dehalococcoidia bacterium]|nr:hypothetical protein [Dehalococcoidia bacterium]